MCAYAYVLINDGGQYSVLKKHKYPFESLKQHPEINHKT